MSSIALIDYYYKIEDKWFDLLDWLDARKIPIYKIIDPIEKAGVPSLPVFFAIFLILIYLILTSLVGGVGFAIQVSDSSSQAGLVANITVTKDGTEVFSGTTDSAGLIQGSLPPGEYRLSVTSMGCRAISNQKIAISNSATIPVPMNCGGTVTQKSAQFCFIPEVEELEVKIENQYGVPKDVQKIKIGENLFIEQGRYYEFKAGGLSSGRLSFDNLVSRSSTSCIELDTPEYIEDELGEVIVFVVNSTGGALVEEVVRLVDPEDTYFDIVTQAFTDDLGEAIFKGPIGKEFKIFVPSPKAGSSSSYLDSTVRNFTEMPQRIEIKLGVAVQTAIIVNSDTGVLRGVKVEIFDNADSIKLGTTSSLGIVTFGAIDGKSYNGLFFKEGYRPRTSAIIGGRDNIVTMEEIDEDETGSIYVETADVDTDLPLSGVSLRLYSCVDSGCSSPTPAPYREKISRHYGTATFTWVLPGNYCIIATKGGGTATNCADNPVTVVKDERTNVNIKVTVPRFRISVNLFNETGGAVFSQEVRLLDSAREEVDTNTTNFEGKTIFSGKENTPYYLNVDFTKDGEIYAVDQYVPPLQRDVLYSLRVAPLRPEVSLTGITRNDEPVDILDAGKTYMLHFAVGMPNIGGNKWDEMKLSIGSGSIDETRYVLFKDGIDPPTSYNAAISENNNRISELQKTITIGADYEPSNTDLVFDVPIIVDNSFSGDNVKTSINYNATWESETTTINNPQSGSHKKEVIISASSSVEFGDLVIYFGLKDRTTGDIGNFPASGTIDQIDNTDLIIIVENNGPEFRGNIEISTDNNRVKFEGITSNFGFYVLDFSQTKATITLSENPLLSTSLDNSLVASLPLNAIHTGPAFITVKIDGKTAATGVLSIVGDDNFYLKISPADVYDLTNNLTISVVDEEGVLIPNPQLLSLTLGGTGVECKYVSGAPTSALKIKPKTEDSSPNMFTVDLVSDCPLPTSASSIVAKGNSLVTQSVIEDSKSVKDCISEVPKGDRLVEQGSETDVGIELNICEHPEFVLDLEFVTASVRLADDGTGTCPTCSLENGDVDLLSSADSRGESIETVDPMHAKIPLNFLFTGFTERRTVVFDVEYKILSHLPEALPEDNIPKEISTSLTVELTKAADGDGNGASFSGTFFTPLEIQKYSDSNIDCKNRYCNIEQALGYVYEKSKELTLTTCDTCEIKQPIEFNLVDLTPDAQQVQKIFSKVASTTGDEVEFQLLSAGKTKPDESGYYIDYRLGKMPKPGRNVAYISREAAWILVKFQNIEPADSPIKKRSIQYLQLYMPWQKETGGLPGKLFRTKLPSDNKVTEMIRTLWGDGSARSDGSDTHIIVTELCEDEADSVCVALQEKLGEDTTATEGAYVYLDDDGKTIKIVGKSEGIIEEMIETLTAVFDKNDDNDPENNLKIINGQVIGFGEEPIFGVHLSSGELKDIEAAVRTLFLKQISSEADLTVVDAPLDEAIMAVIKCGGTCTDPYRDRFESRWSPGASGIHVLSDSLTISWADQNGYTLIGSGDDIPSLLGVWNGGTHGDYEKISDSLVVGYDEYNTPALLEDINTQGTSGGEFSYVVKISDTSACEIQNSAFEKGSFVGDYIQPGGTYLLTVKTDPSNDEKYLVISTQLKEGTPEDSFCGLPGETTNNAVLVVAGNSDGKRWELYRSTTGSGYTDITQYISTNNFNIDERVDAYPVAIDIKDKDGKRETVAIATLTYPKMEVRLLRGSSLSSPIYEVDYDVNDRLSARAEAHFKMIRAAAVDVNSDGIDEIALLWTDSDRHSFNFVVIDKDGEELANIINFDTGSGSGAADGYRNDGGIVAIDKEGEDGIKETAVFMAVNKYGVSVWNWTEDDGGEEIFGTPHGQEHAIAEIKAIDYSGNGREADIIFGWIEDTGTDNDPVNIKVIDSTGEVLEGEQQYTNSNDLVRLLIISYDGDGNGIRESAIVAYGNDNGGWDGGDQAHIFRINSNTGGLEQLVGGVIESGYEERALQIDSLTFLSGSPFKKDENHDLVVIALPSQTAALAGRNTDDLIILHIDAPNSGEGQVNKKVDLSENNVIISVESAENTGVVAYTDHSIGNIENKYSIGFISGFYENEIRIYTGDEGGAPVQGFYSKKFNIGSFGKTRSVAYYRE